MRIFTKSLLTFALLCIAGVVGATETLISSVDYAHPKNAQGQDVTTYPYYFDNGWKPSAAPAPTITDGILVVDNSAGGNYNMVFLNDWMAVKKGYEYRIRITYKTTVAGNISLSLTNWSLWANKDNIPVTVSSDWQVIECVLAAPDNAANGTHVHVNTSIAGVLSYQKIEVYEIPHEWSWDYHIDKTGPGSIKLYPETNPKDATSETGEYTYDVPTKVTFDWDTQFWICANEKIPAGTPVRFTFDYKADKEVSVGPQTFANPGEYIGNVNGQDVAFKTDWNTKTVEVVSPNNDFRCIGLTLTRQASEGVVTYSFRNLKVEVAKDVLQEAPVEADPLISDSDPVIAAAKAALLSAVKKAKRVNVDNYTVASVIEMNKAIIAGEALLNTAGGNAEALAKATNNVLQAIDELQAVPVRGDGVYDLTKEMFLKWNEHSANARAIETLPYSAYDVNKSSGLPYGDGNVNWLCYADLSDYDKLVVIANSGAPRFCFNRTVDNAQDTGDTEGYEKTNFIDIPGKQWGTSFFETVDEDNHRYIIDLKAMTADRGFAHLHSIKGVNFGNVYVAGMYLVKGDVELPTYLGTNENVLQAAIDNGKNADLDNKTKASMKTLSDAIAAGEKLFTEDGKKEEKITEVEVDVKGDDLTFTTAEYCAAQWDATAKTLTWGQGGWNAAWTFMAADGVSGDLSEWTKLHLKVSDFTNSKENKLKVVFQENDGNMPPAGAKAEGELVPDAEGNIDLDLTTFNWGQCPKNNIADMTIYGLDRTDETAAASVKVTEAWLVKKGKEEKKELVPMSTSALVDKMAAAATAINSAVAGLKDRPAPAAEPAVPDGWKSLITNGTLEGEDMSSFFMITKDYTSAQPAVRQDYAGKDDHYAVVLTSKDNPSQDWDTQFFIRSNEVLPGGTKIRLEFDYCATLAGACDTQAHEEPTNYIHWACCNPNPSFTTEWQHYSWEGTVPTQCNGNPHMDNGNYAGYDDNFHSIAFNLAKNKKATTFYFDNIVFLAEDIQTAVKSVEKAEKAGKGEYFDLQGRRVAKPGKGLYILNGKKVLVK